MVFLSIQAAASSFESGNWLAEQQRTIDELLLLQILMGCFSRSSWILQAISIKCSSKFRLLDIAGHFDKVQFQM